MPARDEHTLREFRERQRRDRYNYNSALDSTGGGCLLVLKWVVVGIVIILFVEFLLFGNLDRDPDPPTSPTPSVAIPGSLLGTWSGVQNQSGFKPYPVQLALHPASSGGTDVGTWTLPTIPCEFELYFKDSGKNYIDVQTAVIQGSNCGNALIRIEEVGSGRLTTTNYVSGKIISTATFQPK